MYFCDITYFVVNSSSSSVVSRQIIMISSSSQIDRFICMSVCVHVFCVKLFDGFCVDLSQSFDVVWLHSSTRRTTTSSSSSFFGLEPSSCNLFAFSSLRLAFAAVVNVRPIVRSQKLATHCTFSHAVLAFNHGQACVSLPLAVKSCSFEI